MKRNLKHAHEDGEVKSCNCNEIEGEEKKAMNPTNITKFLGSHILYKKSDPYLTQYLTNLVILIAKGYIPLLCYHPWFWLLVL